MNRSRCTLLTATLCVSLLTLGLAACKQKGPLERAGEEVDEAIDTAKNGGKESMANKADDAVDDLRAGAKDAVHDVKKK
jgi:predicted small lipoprotein YifL